MGVEIETITPGDGGNNSHCLTAQWSAAFLGCVVNYYTRSVCFLVYFQDGHFRRRGSASWCTMSVSEEAGVVQRLLKGAQRLHLPSYVRPVSAVREFV